MLGQHFGDYRLVRLLGSGGFAEVYEAEHLHLPGTKAAIKLLKENFAPQQIEELRKEAILVNTLNHPHIVQLRTFSMERNIPYLVMSYAQGGALDKRHPRGTILRLQEIQLYVRQVAQALHYAHQRRVVHRDLKPANLLLTQDERIQVADFGIAVVAHSSTSRTIQEIAGTLVYMAPEQLRGQAGPASDQYALATIVYQWLCGTVPFDGNGNLQVIFQQQMNEQPPPLRQRVPGLFPNVEYVILKALNKDPGERFASIQEFAVALDEACRPPLVITPGQQLGDYRLVCKLGEGGFAEVYGAEHVLLGTRAAIKLLKGSFTRVQDEALRQEARVVMQLDHPNIIRVHGFSIERNIPYLVMAHAPGGSLATRHQPGIPLPLETIREYVRQIASALQYAHKQNITHRDIKPENILIAQDGRLQVADFGIATMAEATQTGKDIVGSWVYMAPERFDGRAEATSDQYALGVMVYQWLCGVAPFTGNGNMYALSYQHMNEQPPSLSRRLPTLSPRIERVVMRALAKKSVERYPSIQAFAQAFEEACIAPTSVITPPSESKSSVSKPPESKSTTAKPPESKNTTAKSSNTAAKLPESKSTTAKPPENKSTTTKSSESKSTSAGQTLHTFKLSGGKVNTVVWSPDNTRVAVGGDNASMRILDASTGKTLFNLQGHPSVVKSVAWSTDGRLLASAGADKMIFVWEASSGKLVKHCEGHTGAVNSVAWSTDGRLLASGSADNNVHTWEASSGKLLERMGNNVCHSDRVNAVAWSPDGRLIASASSDKSVLVKEAASGKQVYSYKGHITAVNDVAWSPDGRKLASAAGQVVHVWEAVSGKLVCDFKGHSAMVQTIVWSANGRLIASASKDKTVQVWETSSGKPLYRYEDHDSWVQGVAWSPDGRLIASGGGDKTVHVWDAASGKLHLRYQGHSNFVRAVAWSPDGRLIASASMDKSVQVWEASSGTLLQRWWEGVPAGKLVHRYEGHSDAVYAVVWSSDGRLIASASDDKTVQVWEALSGKLQLRYQDHTDFVRAVAWLPNGRYLASGGGDKTVQIWEATSGVPLHLGHAKPVNAVAWSLDGRLLASASNDETVRIWEAASGKFVRRYEGHSKPVRAVVWSPDGKLLASGGEDKVIQVWEAASGKFVRRYEGHINAVNAVAWSRNGRLLASASADQTVRIWEVSTGKVLSTYRDHASPVYAVAWSSDGTRIVSAGNEIRVWQAP